MTTTTAAYAGVMLWFVFWQDLPMGAILVLAGVQTSLSPEQLTTYRVTDLFDTILGKGIGGICTSPVDIRKSFNGLLGTVRNTFDADSEDVTRGMDTNGRQFLWVSENIT